MPLGNLTSQFFANVYLNELDQFVKHTLKAEFYIRYVDDFVIFHHDKKTLESFEAQISVFLTTIGLSLHSDKSKIISLKEGVPFLGYRIFPHYSLPRRTNLRVFRRKLNEMMLMVECNEMSYDDFLDSVRGWMEYAKCANTFNMRRKIGTSISLCLGNHISERDLDRWFKMARSN